MSLSTAIVDVSHKIKVNLKEIIAYQILKQTHFDLDNKISRGCASSLTAEEVEVCNSDESNVCVWCEGLNCNTEAPPSSANALTTLSLIAMIVLSLSSLWL